MEAVKLLLKAKANVDIADNNGQTPLLEVVRWSPEKLELLRLLLKLGADPQAKNTEGQDALAIVVEQIKYYSSPSADRRRSFDKKMVQSYEAIEDALTSKIESFSAE